MQVKYLLISLFLFIVFCYSTNAQLTGTKTIPGDYATIQAAISALNSAGVGSGGVTFNVAANHTETFTTPTAGTITTTTSAVGSPIVFQKSGVGNNPLITAGTGTTTTTDGIIKIAGGDYVTFDGINLQENAGNTTNTTRMEWGYALVKRNSSAPFDGCQYVTIKNCTITLNKANANSVGIYSGNHIATATTSLNITSTTDAMNYGKFFNNTINNVYIGISLAGRNAASPYTLYDQNNEIGVDGANTITNFGGGGSTAYGVYLIYQNNVNVSNNTINNTANGGSNFTTTGYGIFHSTSTNGNGTYNSNNINLSSNTGQLRAIMSGTAGIATLTANDNTITLSQAGTSEATGIYFQSLSAGSTININDNTFSYGSFASTTISYLINCNNDASNITASGNQTSDPINKTGASGTFYCYYNNDNSGTSTESIFDNTFTNITLTGSSAFNGIFTNFNSGSRTQNIYDNIISNITLGATSAFDGIYSTSSAGSTQNIHDNSISDITGGSGTIRGLYVLTANNRSIFDNQIYDLSGSGPVFGIWSGAGNSPPGQIYRNNIYNLSSASASSTVYGIRLTSGTFYIYNNFISELKMPSVNAANPIVGIYVPSGITARLFFNTIYLNAKSSGSNFGSSGIYYETGGTLEMQNNIIINVSKPGKTGSTVVFRMDNNNSLGNYSANSNNNCFYAGPPRSNKLICLAAAVPYQTIAQFKLYVGPTRDAASFTENVPFVNIALNNLHVKTDVPTLTESGGIAVSSPIVITTDYDGDTRNATPDVGADEFAGIVNTDPVPPVITYTPLGGGGVASSRNFPGVSITDASGVNTTSGTAPRVYFKKIGDANTFNNNTSATDGWKWVEATGTGPFSFLIDYSLLNGGSVVVGDTIQYFVVAQDLYSLPNVAINSGTFETQPTSVNLIADNFPILGTINSYSILGGLIGTILVGTGQSYTSFTADSPQGLFKKINESIISGDITIRITSNLTETGAVALNQTIEEANYSITIQPDDASTKTISGNYNGGLIRLNGADRVTIDGRFAGNGRYLSFSNNAGSGVIAAFQIISLGTNAGATDITIRNCNISTGYNNSLGSNAITSGGSSISSEGDDNDNLTIVNNVITNAHHGINIEATLSGVTNNISITGNIIGSETPGEYVGKNGISIIQANGVNITGNTIFNIINSSTNDNSYGIALWTGVTNSIISGNRIHSVKYSGTSGWGGIGIGITTGISNANILVKNNLIYDISGDGYYFDTDLWRNPHGIFLSSNQSGIKILNNSINLFGNTLNQINAISTGIGIGMGSLAVADIKNNIIVNNLGLQNSTGYGSVGIFLESGTGQLEASSNNLIYVNPSGSGVKYIGQINATGYPTLQSWRAVTGQDKYSFSGNPAFTSNTNLLPDNTNPNCWAVNNKGMPLTDVATDFNGVLRSTTVTGGPVDIGAYEFSTGTTPPSAIQGGTLGNNETSTYNVFEFESTSIDWGSSGTPTGITFLYYSGIEPPGADNNTSNCYWDITQSGGSGFTYDITFNYDPAQIGAITSEDDIRLAKSTNGGTSWTPFLDPGTNPNQYQLNTIDNTIKVHGLSSFSLFALTDVDGALPVELNSFTAALNGRDINLNWETETEVNSYGFEIERASSSTTPLQDWQKIGFVAGHGNSNSPKHYSFADNNLNSGKYIYRLKMVDNDGSYEFSPEIESEIGVPIEYLLAQNYPNPFNPTTKIEYQLPFESSVTIELYNIAGERVDVLVNQEQAAGYYTVEVNSTQFRLSSGVYIYRMTAMSSRDSKSFTQLKKMVLLK